ncbi:MAG: phosphoglucosamine mutase [Candidatus Krumholzibacteria bacterium]|nr:phosphoglucosamine mutase [Candidatus Krumholzibacteria bacterium]
MKEDKSLMVSVSGVRGILGPGMNPESAARYTAAYASLLGCRHVVVGRDTRASGPLLSEMVVSVLRFMGIDVTDLGIAATPTVEIMVGHLDADGGIIITASHNDEKWNALKFLDSNGEFIDEKAVAAIRTSVESGDLQYRRCDPVGGYNREDGADDVHIARILGLPVIDRKKISSRGMKVVIDCVNGAGSRIVPKLLGHLGVTVQELFTDVDSPFPHDPEPRPANLSDLSNAVSSSEADLGFACDPDADRLVLVDGNGNVCSEELTIALAADYILGKEKGPVVVNLSSSRIIDDIAEKHGVVSVRSKVGEANVISAMKDSGAVIGGEGNGGVIFPAIHYGRDAMTGIALILQLLAEEDLSLSEKIKKLPGYEIVKKKMPFSGNMEKAMELLKNEFKGEYNTLDGMRIDMSDGWIHLRRSNTEPVVRIIAEADNIRDAEFFVDRAITILEST